MSKVKVLSFAGQTIFVGLDVHKKNWAVYGVMNGQEVIRESKDPDSDKLIKSLTERFPGAHFSIVYEAGYCGFGHCRRMRELGADCIVVNAADIPTNDKDRRMKTDQRDARKLALELCKGTLRAIHVPDIPMQSYRALSRHREDLAQRRAACINKIKHFLHYHNIKPGQPVKALTKGMINMIRAVNTGSETLNFTLHCLLDELETIRQWVKKDIFELRRLSREAPELKEVQALLQSIDGIGLITAMILQTELMDIKRFKNMNHLSSFVGVVPDMNSSGDRSAKCGMTKRGNSSLKKALIESSWTAIRKDSALRCLFFNYCQTMHQNEAIVRIAKHLLARVRAVWISKKPYERGTMGPQKDSPVAA